MCVGCWGSAAMAMESSKSPHLYSILIPTYNERLNIALICYLLFKHLKSVSYPSSLLVNAIHFYATLSSHAAGHFWFLRMLRRCQFFFILGVDFSSWNLWAALWQEWLSPSLCGHCIFDVDVDDGDDVDGSSVMAVRLLRWRCWKPSWFLFCLEMGSHLFDRSSYAQMSHNEDEMKIFYFEMWFSCLSPRN